MMMTSRKRLPSITSITQQRSMPAAPREPSTPAVDRDLVVEGPRTADRADEIDLRWSRCPFFLRLPESAGGGSP